MWPILDLKIKITVLKLYHECKQFNWIPNKNFQLSMIKISFVKKKKIISKIKIVKPRFKRILWIFGSFLMSYPQKYTT